MNFDERILNIASGLHDLANNLESVKSDYATAKDFTMKLLDECRKVNIKAVAIGVSDKSVKSSVDFPFGARGSIFAMGKDKTGWPAIWGCVERAGIASGCGNSDQQQISDDSQVVDGLYKFKDGKWSKVK